MAKRKKNPRLPNNFGSIRYLGKGRSLPYAVHPPAKERDSLGHYIRPAALCYVPDWYTGFAVLSAYHAGTYTPGLETTIRREVEQSYVNLDAFCRRVMKDHALASGVSSGVTFANVYEAFYEWKFGENAAKKLSDSARKSMRAAFLLVPDLHDVPLSSITLTQLQETVNGLNKSQSSTQNVVSLIKQIYRYALPRELCEKDLGAYVVMPSTRAQEHREPFTDEDLKVLWMHQSDPIVSTILIMCYSGYRLSAYQTIETNLDNLYFRGGIKTASGKGRIVPIHSGIVHLVRAKKGVYLSSPGQFRAEMARKLGELSLPRLTPHSCRHTFSRLCESYGVAEADRKRMMGHSFGADITNGVYGHRTVEELRREIEKIQIPDL